MESSGVCKIVYITSPTYIFASISIGCSVAGNFDK